MPTILTTLFAGFSPLQRASLLLVSWAVGLAAVLAAVLTFADALGPA